jgi:hypothetical protein
VDHDPQGRPRVNRITYEICALEALCVSSSGARRSGSPAPTATATRTKTSRRTSTRRDEHYAALGLPRSADAFAGLQEDMRLALSRLDLDLPRNADVRISRKAGDGQVGDGAEAGHRGCRGHPAPLLTGEYTAPDLQGIVGTREGLKTPFLACYLVDHALLRREINDGLNVVEQWNSANDFIFARQGEFSSNRRENQELSVLSPTLAAELHGLREVQQVPPDQSGRAGSLHALTPP